MYAISRMLSPFIEDSIDARYQSALALVFYFYGSSNHMLPFIRIYVPGIL